MTHLPIHLAREAILAGPVQFRWQFPFERCIILRAMLETKLVQRVQ
ncbi:hypothetical protein RchiOBHm_Chr4g0415141 [Rosa chinensis]|uniref:DUF4218 domain-containing protein n=1 Tax=Rosa chinensis TaxID=74649 RepID=A0A2P6QWI3_ROSCH|nr:hypothetical protein RchiOBHm_Chr4g0415141 [Rosa chinensis]